MTSETYPPPEPEPGGPRSVVILKSEPGHFFTPVRIPPTAAALRQLLNGQIEHVRLAGGLDLVVGSRENGDRPANHAATMVLRAWLPTDETIYGTALLVGADDHGRLTDTPPVDMPLGVVTEQGVTYEPWSHGPVVGWAAWTPDAEAPTYLYLTPATSGGDHPTVLAFTGPHGDSDRDTQLGQVYFPALPDPHLSTTQ